MGEMRRADFPELVRFGASFVRSEAFKELFREGMNLVEETAAYLDGPGRAESARLGRQAALAYAGESMKLTTRLMQVASWLLVQRAVSEGEITADQARREKDRVRLGALDTAGASGTGMEALPEGLRDLIGLSVRLHARIVHLDALIVEAEASPEPPRRSSPVAAQHGLLAQAFGLR